MACSVCRHNQVKDIDRALITGVSLPSLSKTYGLGTAALHLHRQHLQQKMAHAQQRFHDGLRQALYCKLTMVMEMVFGVVRGARANEDFKLFLQASREFTRIVSLMHKMDVRLEPEFIYCLMASPQWDLQEDSLLPGAFQTLAKTRQSLKVNLYAPCPEPAAAPVPDTWPTLTPETPDVASETLSAHQVPDPLPQISALPVRQQPGTSATSKPIPASIRAGGAN
jgi:hypothetical protein